MQQRRKAFYKATLRDKVSAVLLRRWPFNYACGKWDKHKPDASGKEYVILINRTRGVECGKVTLLHELEHIADDLTKNERPHEVIESTAVDFYYKNKRFVGSLWRKYVGRQS